MSYHEEQETLDNLKTWWVRWGNRLIGALLVVLLAGAGWSGWNYWQGRQAAQAARLYEQLQQVVPPSAQTLDKERLARILDDMKKQFGRTPYAQMSALMAAKAFYQAEDSGAAKTQLQWVIEHARDAEYQQIARLRLASILLEEKAYEQGLNLLAEPPKDTFKALYADRRGDLFAAQGKRDDARQAYKDALQLLTADNLNNGPIHRLVQLKLDALGG
ncbi:MAG: putative negative regulator of RcsB-dependent stress response [Glomeribacter sp. 1016415]|uniref:Ancillary SecYEG translocon subunit n=1 Tax=Mycoavidus cysteinexigens TaxID=1553431 RepID=A0A2Z6ETZ9_9BURK|nr:tetratricopeptide repeat protein [Mycoavidus cysteinexigens]MCX8565449.1 putative negative regulator of RcsB-dependent stress response [Glomeribacter sp. 1016415]BBE08896.1 Uncharacterized protein MCB1EB_0735 [Mycoavidus cysteinexigens]GAM52384.1 hypothetical protein EBME_0847 [bacterium endosymbiont of Mortierella elongata FMR23-6]GLR01260.1 hypothetical protein GCM10007934_10720 [Mycoavidus cysteinexigens]